VREQIKEIAQLDGAIIIRRDGVAVAACMMLDVPMDNITLSKGLGSRHWVAAAMSKHTKAIAVAVSQSSGTVRLFQDGQIVLRIEPHARPLIWRHFEMEAQESDAIPNPVVAPG
jgi:DNA integrity scanning protein DisA with diadenylate cyclase activity